MTIDERLEALTQSVELLTHDVRDLTNNLHGLTNDVRGLQSFVRDVAESTARLLHIAQIHEHRITRLEGEA